MGVEEKVNESEDDVRGMDMVFRHIMLLPFYLLPAVVQFEEDVRQALHLYIFFSHF